MSTNKRKILKALSKLDAELHKSDQTPKRNGNNAIIILAVVLAILLCVCVYLVIDTISIGTKAVNDAYDEAKSNAISDTYNAFYERSYTDSEKAHHVKNVAAISVGNLREVQKLEVLKVYDVVYNSKEVENDKLFSADIDAWLEVPGYGVFTVNLHASEFIIDDERQYVLVRVPVPELSTFDIDDAGVAMLHYTENNGFTEQPKAGVDLAEQQYKEAYIEMQERIRGEQEYVNKAKNATKNVLKTLVTQLNPQLPELVVEIEFME